ncbi:autotransporter outer membrane beta-barrel domain-containing protein [Buttiauxella sp. A111]|uniref:autotransporter family protein n=1 Tax=Buttiauxella sp. A111 TaxID=2563088 RepID=UPI0010E70AB0|nr:autotransporter outer membrane beta-barrel domain-containing protein [Buttiauxella sp. A111]GDX04644.1 hypothetical protein BSPA111_08120 [Buttiauxella sp. A111]
MKKRTPNPRHTKKLMLASLISVAATNHVHAQDYSYNNQTVNNSVYLNGIGVQNVTVDKSTFNNSLSVTSSWTSRDLNNGISNVKITDSDFKKTSTIGSVLYVYANGATNVDISNTTVGTGAYYSLDIKQDVVNVDAQIATTNITGSSFAGASRFGVSHQLLTVSDSQFGSITSTSKRETTADIKDTTFTGALNFVSGTATSLSLSNTSVEQPKGSAQSVIVSSGTDSAIDIDNYQIMAPLKVDSVGDTRINLSNGSLVNSDISAKGATTEINIDKSAIAGNISVGNTKDTATDTANTTVNIANATYRGNITSTNDVADDSLTLNVNNGGIIGGETVDTSQKITGFNRVSTNINYVDPTLLNTGKASYFFFNDGEEVAITNKVGTNSILDTVRSGSYINDLINYQVTDESAKQGLADKGYYSIVFSADPIPDPVDPVDPVTPVDPVDPVTPVTPVDPVTPPAPAPKPEPRIAADLQAAQAGLLASDDMIHRIANSVTQHLDARHMGENGPQTSNSNVWMDGIYSGGDRTAGSVEYSNEITGFQLGADTSWALSNGDLLTLGAGLGYLHNNLDVTSSDGSNDIDGNYYSLYAGWTQHQAEGQNWHLFADTTATYGDMSYSASGKDGTLKAGGDYDGNSWLWQARVGAQVNLADNWWVQPYGVLGYSETKTDAYSDGYSHVSEGKYSTGFAGAGVKAGKNITLKGGQTLSPYIETAYVGRFSDDTQFNTSDYNFGGQNLNGGSIGAGLNATLSKNWSATAKVNTIVASDVNNEVHAYLGAELKF